MSGLIRQILKGMAEARELTGLFTCPCCGGTPEMCSSNTLEWIECSNCGLATEVTDPGEARKLWNRRV